MSPASVARWVRLRAHPVGDKASKTKRRGQQMRHAPSERIVGLPQEGKQTQSVCEIMLVLHIGEANASFSIEKINVFCYALFRKLELLPNQH